MPAIKLGLALPDVEPEVLTGGRLDPESESTERMFVRWTPYYERQVFMNQSFAACPKQALGRCIRPSVTTYMIRAHAQTQWLTTLWLGLPTQAIWESLGAR